MGDTDSGAPGTSANASAGTTAETSARGVGERLRYLLKLSRPRFWFYLAGPVVVAVAYAADTVADLFAPLAVGLFVYFLLPANVLLYGINDVFDADVDEENPKKEAKEVRFEGDRFVVAAVVVCGLAGLALFPLVPRVAWGYLAGFFALGVEYSAPPFRFKTTPLLDSISNGLYVLPGAATYAALAGAPPPLLALVGGWAWTMAMHTFSAIPDIEPDRRAGIETTATVLGRDWSFVYCGALWLMAAVLFAELDVRLGVLLLSYPLVLVGVYGSGVDVDRAYWWYPALNTAVGAMLTLGGLWLVVYG
ncbi:MAG: prenyltransferase [Haloferacaceae archaeon]|jgi:4-hydroxybenzoate polyprenyltransferase